MKKVLGITFLMLLTSIALAKEDKKSRWDQTVEDIRSANTGNVVTEMKPKDKDGMLCYGDREAINKCFYFVNDGLILEFRVIFKQYTSQNKQEAFLGYLNFIVGNEVKHFGKDPDAVEFDPELTQEQANVETMGKLIATGKVDVSFAWQDSKNDLIFMLMVFQQDGTTIIMRHWQKLSFLATLQESTQAP